jgi:hypothetical protein
MQFIQFGMLGALVALAIPVIIHLMFRQRARTVELGTLQFLKIVLRDNAKRRRLRRYILLALRLACVALIALLFARPYLLAVEPVEGDRLVVVLVDRSASMGLKGGRRPIDRALAEVRSLSAQAGQGTRLEVAFFDANVHPLAKLADLPSSLEPTFAATDYDAALAWARDLCIRSRAKTKEIHILTDLQRSGLDRGESVTLPPGVDVHLVDLGRAFPKDVAVTAIAMAPTTIRPGEKATITATVRNTAPLPIRKVPVRLHLEAGDQSLDLDKTLDLDGGASATVDFAPPPFKEGLWRGHVEAAASDDLAFDDRRYLALSVAPASRILLVDGDPGRSSFESETYFLQAALRLAPQGERYAKSPFDPRVVDGSGGASLPDLSGIDAVVLANVERLAPADVSRLREFVAKGGGVLVFTGDKMKADAVQTLSAAGLGVGEFVGIERTKETPWRLDRWEAGTSVFRPFQDPEHGDLRRPAFTAVTRMKPVPEVRVLATFRGGLPALLERDQGLGRVLWFTSACDRSWGDWPRGRMFLPMVHQMLAYVTGLTEGGKVRTSVATSDRAAGITDDGGLCRVVNPDPLESETARCTPQEFADRYGFRLPVPTARASVAARGDEGRRTTDEAMRNDEIWPWLALALIGGLAIENFLANRTAA